MSDERSEAATSRAWAGAASEAFHASAEYFRALPDDAWHDPTGCADWDERYLAGHILGEAVWFPNLVRGLTSGEERYPSALYDEMMDWPPERQIPRLDAAADELVRAVEEAPEDACSKIVDIEWTKVPLWRATYVILMEGAYHDWDTRARREPNATIPTPWALELTRGLEFSAPLVAHRAALAGAPGRYRLQLTDGPDAFTVLVEGERLSFERGASGEPDLTLYVTADQCARLVAGRFPLAGPVEDGSVRIQGDRERIAGLNRIFGGIANG